MASIKSHPTSIEVQLPVVPLDQSRRHACLAFALQAAEHDIEVLSVADVIRTAEAFERFIVGPAVMAKAVAGEWPPKPVPAEAPAPKVEQPAASQDQRVLNNAETLRSAICEEMRKVGLPNTAALVESHPDWVEIFHKVAERYVITDVAVSR